MLTRSQQFFIQKTQSNFSIERLSVFEPTPLVLIYRTLSAIIYVRIQKSTSNSN